METLHKIRLRYCHPLGHSFIIPEESKAPQWKAAHSSTAGLNLQRNSIRNLIPFPGAEISAPKQSEAKFLAERSAPRSCERQQKRTGGLRTPGTSKVLRGLPGGSPPPGDCRPFHVTVSEGKQQRTARRWPQTRPDAENAEVRGRGAPGFSSQRWSARKGHCGLWTGGSRAPRWVSST